MRLASKLAALALAISLLSQILALAQINNPGGGKGTCIATVATLNSACGTSAGTQASVTDGSSTTDCTVGGGSNKVPCLYSGIAWGYSGAAGTGNASSLTASGPNPWTDLTNSSYGAIGDGKVGLTGRITGTAVTLNSPGSQWTFAAGDVGKTIELAGNPFSTATTLGAGTAANNTSGLLATGTASFGGSVNVTYCVFLVPIQDNGTMAQGVVNGTGVKSNEVCTPVTPTNNSISFAAPSTIAATATGYRVYGVDQEQLISVSSGTGTCTNGTYIVHFPGSGTNPGQGAMVQVVVTGGTTLAYTVVAPGRGYNAAPSMPTFSFCSGQPSAPVITMGGNNQERMEVASTAADHVKCSTQSAANIRDNACDPTASFILYRHSYTGGYASTTGLWLTKITAFTSTTAVTVADSIPAAISSNTNIAWGTDNSAAFSTAYTAITALIANTTLAAPRGAKFCFPPVGATNSPTGRYYAVGGFRIPYGNGAVVSGNGGGVAAGIELSTCGGSTPRAYVQVDSQLPGNYSAGGEAAILGAFGQDYALHLGACGGNCTPEVPNNAVPTDFIMSSGGSIRGVSIHDIGVEDPLTTSSLGGVFMDGDWGPTNNQSDNITVEHVFAGNFCAGEAFIAAGVEISDFRFNNGMALVAYHFRDDVSDVTAEGGRFASCRQLGLLNGNNGSTMGVPGPGWGMIAENNPIGESGAAPGNNRFLNIRIMDEYEGYCRFTDQQSSYCGNAGKLESNSLSGGACAGKCYGIAFFNDSAALSASHCKNNVYEMSQVAKVASLYQIGTGCDSTDIFEVGGQQIMSMTQGSPALFGYIDNGTNSDNLVGNALNNVSAAFSTPSGFFKDQGLLQNLGGNTSTVSTASPPTISVFNSSTGPSSWTLPGGNFSGHCWIPWQQNTAVATVLFGIRTIGVAPTNLRVTGNYTNVPAGTAVAQNTFDSGNLTTLGATTLVTITPGAAATAYELFMDFTIEAVAGTTLEPTFSTSNASDAAVSLRGAYCRVWAN